MSIDWMNPSDRQLAEMVNRLVADVTQTIWSVLSLCESPIEKLVLAELVQYAPASGDRPRSYGMGFVPVWGDPDTMPVRGQLPAHDHRIVDTKGYLGLKIGDAFASIAIQPTVQPTNARYRLDLAVIARSVAIAIECDGHDFHERTKEQAERDRSRDRDLTTSGWIVLRYTGREIVRDPFMVASQIIIEAAKHLAQGGQ